MKSQEISYKGVLQLGVVHSGARGLRSHVLVLIEEVRQTLILGSLVLGRTQFSLGLDFLFSFFLRLFDIVFSRARWGSVLLLEDGIDIGKLVGVSRLLLALLNVGLVHVFVGVMVGPGSDFLIEVLNEVIKVAAFLCNYSLRLVALSLLPHLNIVPLFHLLQGVDVLPGDLVALDPPYLVGPRGDLVHVLDCHV